MEIDINDLLPQNEPEEVSSASAGADTSLTDRKTVLSGMFRNWYLEYASYVILERAVPHIEDGLKPVQRRILHSLKTLDDGRFNKVANIVGNTMQYHPHGDASINDALVQLGQKDLLVETQGNWGNILTGDRAAAGRYIEARLSELALETVFSEKVTEWMPTYDGRKKEPVTLPVKFPLLLIQGVEGIAVGLSSKILPHNFREVMQAAVSYLKGEEFQLLPDFQTGGLMDVSHYNDGARGGKIKVRAKIEKIDNKTLAITELPFGQTTSSLIDSILSAMEKGKIKVRKVDDNTSATAQIVVHLIPGTSSDKAIDALYAFTDCEQSISPNCCVIVDNKPAFLSVSDVLRNNVDRTLDILRRELEIRLGEMKEAQLLASLEKIFIEERMYKDKQTEEAENMDAAIAHIDKRMEPFKTRFFREITRDDLLRLWEIKMGRILKFNSKKAEERIAELDKEIAETAFNIEHIRDYTIRWFTLLDEKYGDKYPRRTVVRNFDSIEVAKVADANRRLYYDAEGAFIGTSLKDKEFLFTCSDLDDVIIFYKDGTYKIVRVAEKLYIDKGKKVLPGGIRLFKRGDKRTIYNVIYRNGKKGPSYKKRFYVTGLTRDKLYDMTKGLPGTEVKWFTANPNGEAETVRVRLKDEPDAAGRRPRVLDLEVNFATLDIKGKESLGNLVTKYEIRRITLKESGASTLGGRKVWFDKDVLRLNYDGRGEEIGTFEGNDKVLVVRKNGEYFTTTYSDTNHYPDDILSISKFDPNKVFTLIFRNADAGNFPYIKRFVFEDNAKPQRFVGSDEKSEIIMLSDAYEPMLKVIFGGADAVRPPMEVPSSEFIAVKGFKAKGKRISTYECADYELIASPEPEPELTTEEPIVDEEPTPRIPLSMGEDDPQHTGETYAVQGNLFDDLDIDD